MSCRATHNLRALFLKGRTGNGTNTSGIPVTHCWQNTEMSRIGKHWPKKKKIGEIVHATFSHITVHSSRRSRRQFEILCRRGPLGHLYGRSR